MYNPSEDSFFLSEALEEYLKGKNKDIKILDMGSGSGIQAETCLNLGFKNIICVDVDKEAVELLEQKGFKAINSDLFSNIKGRLGVKGNLVPLRFDLIIFNPPYLPENKYDREKDTRGGKEGYEIIVKFLKKAREHLDKRGEILLLFSSLSKPETIKKQAKKLGYKIEELSSKKLFFEELFVYLLKR